MLVSAVRVNWYRRSGEKREAFGLTGAAFSLLRREKKKTNEISLE